VAGNAQAFYLFDTAKPWRPEAKPEPKIDAGKAVKDMTPAEYEAHRKAELRKLGGRGHRHAYLHEPASSWKGKPE
jgi:hypothetical protein